MKVSVGLSATSVTHPSILLHLLRPSVFIATILGPRKSKKERRGGAGERGGHKETGMGILVPIIGPIKHLGARGPKAVPGPTFIPISFIVATAALTTPLCRYCDIAAIGKISLPSKSWKIRVGFMQMFEFLTLRMK